MGIITRAFEFDAAHRVMNEKVKCFNLHGHRFKVELTFHYEEKKKLGYAIDFKEIKRVACGWIDENLDHACILNPMDADLIALCAANGWRKYIMGFCKYEDINPSAENLAEELFIIVSYLMAPHNITLTNLRLYETPNCWVDCCEVSVAEIHPDVFKSLDAWMKEKGIMNYDIREE